MAEKKDISSSQMGKTSLSSFVILTLALPSHPALSTPAVHYLYIRRDLPKNPTTDTPRSLYLSNVPIDSTESTIRALFKQLGGARVARVVFEAEQDKSTAPKVGGETWGVDSLGSEKNRKRKHSEGEKMIGREEYTLPETWDWKLKKSGSSAVVVLVDRATADAAMKEAIKLSKKGNKLQWAPPESIGLTRYISHHELTYPPESTLQHSINSFLSQYATIEKARSNRLKELRSEPDEDGFITVTRGGRNKPLNPKTAQIIAERAKDRQDKKKVGNGFYRFQAREEAKRKERELRDKFEDDARRLNEMRKRRGTIKPE